jgi:membrane protease subunit (stomatin/prohibitin family)
MGLSKLFGKKPSEGKLQEFDNILWGTTAPVILVLSSGITQVRVRGSCSVAVTNPQVFVQMLGDSSRMATQVKAIIVNKITDALFEVSRGKADLIDIISSSDEMAGMVKAIVEPALNALGLTLKQFEIQAIERG